MTDIALEDGGVAMGSVSADQREVDQSGWMDTTSASGSAVMVEDPGRRAAPQVVMLSSGRLAAQAAAGLLWK